MGIFDNEDVQGMGYGDGAYEPRERIEDETEGELSEENHADHFNDCANQEALDEEMGNL